MTGKSTSGMTILRVKNEVGSRGEIQVVLGRTPRGEYATWKRRKDEPKNLFHGHYYGNESFRDSLTLWRKRK